MGGGAPDAMDRGLQAHGAGRQTVGEGVHQRLHAVPERREQAVAGAADARLRAALALSVPQREDQTAVTLLHVQELWHRGPHAEMARVSGVNAAEHRLGHAFQGFPAQAAGDEVGEGFVVFRGATGQHEVQGHAQLAGPAEGGGGHERPQGTRRHQVEPLRHRHELAVAHNEALAMFGGGADQFGVQPEFVTQFDAPGLGGEEAVRPLFQKQAVLVTGGDDAAEPVTGLQQHDVKRQIIGLRLLHKTVTGGQAGDAAADDHRSLAFRRLFHAVLPPPTPFRRRVMQIREGLMNRRYQLLPAKPRHSRERGSPGFPGAKTCPRLSSKPVDSGSSPE